MYKDLKRYVSDIDDELFNLAVPTFSNEIDNKGDVKLLAFHLPFSRALTVKNCEEKIKKVIGKVRTNYKNVIMKICKFQRTDLEKNLINDGMLP